MTKPAVEIAGVAKRFGTTTALERVDFTIAANEFVSLLGASGCGKSTLLRIISGFEQPSEGVVRIYGEDVTGKRPEQRPTNMVFQRGALFPHMNVRENIGYALKLRRWDRRRIDARVEEMLALVRLEGLGDRGPTELSGGQMQRVALARALAGEPKVLLLDEPLSALDLKLRQQMQLELRAIQRKLHATFVFVTHDQTEALVMSDRIAIMNRGRIVQSGSPQDIYKRPASVFVSDFIGQTNLLPGRVVEAGPETVTVEIAGARLAVPAGEAPAVAPGDRATLSVRPEAVRMRHADGPDAEARPSGLAGTVADIVYLGSSVRVGATIADGTMLWADLRDEEADGLAAGTAVILSWSPAAPRLLAGE